MMSDSQSESEFECEDFVGSQSSQSVGNYIILNSQTMLIDDGEDEESLMSECSSRNESSRTKKSRSKQTTKKSLVSSARDNTNWDASLPFKYVRGDISFSELTSIMENNCSISNVSPSSAPPNKVVIEEASESDDLMSEDENADEQQRNFRSAEEFENEMATRHDGRSSSATMGVSKGRRKKLAKDLLGLVGQANLHFVRGDHDGAINMCMEVIRLAPTSPEPFQTLSLIYEEKRQFEKAYQYSLISAYLNPSDGDNWIKVAEMAIELKNYSQAIICYNKAIKIYPKNLSLYQDRCKLYKLIDDKKRALDAYETLYNLISKEPETPQNQEMALQTAKEIAMLHYFNQNVETSINVMEENLKKYKRSIINEDVNLYLELLISSDQYIKALNAFKKYCGVNFRIGGSGKVIDFLTDEIVDEQRDKIDIELVYAELQIDLRAKLAVCLINLKIFKFVDELKNFIIKENPDEMGDLFLDIADAYIKINDLKGAEPLLKLLVFSKTYDCSSVWLKYARLLRDLGKLELSIDAYYEVIKHLPKSIEAKLELSDLLVKLGRVEDATEATGQSNNTQLNLDLLLVRCNLLFKQKMYKEFIIAGKILLASEFTFLANESEMSIMITSASYKSRIENLRDLYREQGDRLDVSELTSNDYNFVGNQLTADDLVDIFAKYCCALYETKNYTQLIKMVFSAYTSSLSTDKIDYYDFLALNSCMLTRDTTFLYKAAKMAVLKNVNNNQLWNFFSVMMLNIYQDFRHNKFCIRMSLKNQNCVPLAFINGHNALTSGNYKVAMAEYIHIFKQQPTDSFAIFCILIGFTHLACQKFISNKHSVVSQLCAFLNLYLQMRGECQESLYNVGRSFHQLGLLHEAIHFYKRALEIEDQIECDSNEKVSICYFLCFQKVLLHC